jgi:hypothetical protein
VRLLDLVRAADAAALVGDVHGVRSLLATIVRALECPDIERGGEVLLL